MFYPLKKFDFISGYVYISLRDSNVKVLNSNLQVSEQRTFNNYISSHTVLNGNIGICTIDFKYDRTRCFKLDSQLKTEEEYFLKNNRNNYYWKILNLVNGDYLAISVSKHHSTSVEVRRLAKDGRVGKSHFFTLRNCSSQFDPFIKFNELHRKYCFSFACKSERITHCIPSFRLAM